ncbi:Arc family DNA-binding protein [Vibrio azureus]|nr:Arc family DNA-binding protein [Vibrio azureus]
MTQRPPQINVRMPEDLKKNLHLAAKEHNISVNAEIVSRLSSSFIKETPIPVKLPNANEAKQKTIASRAFLHLNLMNRISNEVHRRSALGLFNAYICLREFELASDAEPVIETVIKPVISSLVDCGYTLPCDWSIEGFTIAWE